jgi:UDP-3-O-[3-hydroxymyristoyl] glucosamine N-acyltransferase
MVMYLRDLISKLGGEAVGEVGAALTGVGTLEKADASEISFLANPKYRRALNVTNAAAVIVAPSERDVSDKPRIVVDNPYTYFARVAQLFAPRRTHRAGVHPSAVIAPTAVVSTSASIAEFVSIGDNSFIGEHVRLGPGTVIAENVRIGASSELTARVVVYSDCQIGERVMVHAGVVIGADGFGFANDNGAWVKIPQTGRVVIGNDCEIGANTTIDRGAIEDTILGDDVKLDNQIQIAHNCVIGDHTIIAGCTGVAGSTLIGKRVMIGGAVSITGHLSICDDAVLSANAFVTKSINEPGMYSSGLPLMAHRDWLKNAAQLRHLDELADAVKNVEKKMKNRGDAS